MPYVPKANRKPLPPEVRKEINDYLLYKYGQAVNGSLACKAVATGEPDDPSTQNYLYWQDVAKGLEWARRQLPKERLW